MPTFLLTDDVFRSIHTKQINTDWVAHSLGGFRAKWSRNLKCKPSHPRGSPVFHVRGALRAEEYRFARVNPRDLRSGLAQTGASGRGYSIHPTESEKSCKDTVTHEKLFPSVVTAMAGAHTLMCDAAWTSPFTSHIWRFNLHEQRRAAVTSLLQAAGILRWILTGSRGDELRCALSPPVTQTHVRSLDLLRRLFNLFLVHVLPALCWTHTGWTASPRHCETACTD